MGVEVMQADQGCCLLCNTSDSVYGPLFHEDADEVYAFLDWLPMDSRRYTESELDTKVYEWRMVKGEE